MNFQVQTHTFSRFTFSFLQYSFKFVNATLQVSSLHVPPYTVWCLVPYVFIYTFISMFLNGGNKNSVLVNDKILVIFFNPWKHMPGDYLKYG
jgi:hypothetical protein